MRRIFLSSLSAAMSAASAVTAFAGFTIEGGHDDLVIDAQDASRSEIVSSIVQRFGIERTGEAIQGGTVTGSFSGDLHQVLVAIAPNNGYAIAYSDGRPSRITFTVNQGVSHAQGTAREAANPSQDAGGFVAPAQDAAETSGANEAPTMERILERQLQGIATVPQPEPSRRPSSSNGNAADMTLRARQELEALVRAIRQSQP